ncbi:MAG: sulfatase-like hydrolase/transferase [bacterium]|nr:sulfatase-like hydrolase/transferase [Candidatus Minthenecus merdequi]
MNRLTSFIKKPIPLIIYSVILSSLNLIFYNIPFFKFVVSHCEGSVVYIVASLVVLMIVVNAFAIMLLVRLTRWVGRSLICIANILSSAGVFFAFTYGTILDEAMMSCFFNTRPSEASGFITIGLIFYIIIFGILPSLWLFLQNIKLGSWRNWFISLSTSLGICIIVILVNLNNFLWIGKYDTELGGLLMPWSYVVNSCRLAIHHHNQNQKAIPLPDGQFTDSTRTAVILVIGESARADHFQLYGYNRTTNPRLSARDDINVIRANSNYTYTTAAVKCILQPNDESDLYETLPDYLLRMGADVSWRTSNWGEPPLHIKEYQTLAKLAEEYDIENSGFDEILVTGLTERIASSDKDKVFIVLHTSTSHGPCYDSKYPDNWRIFRPVARDVESADKDIPGLTNAYDNTILYTDFLIDTIISQLETLKEWETSLIYISDHGESLGENKVFMHGVPRSMAPAAQYEIPLLVWLSHNNSFKVRDFDEPVNQTYIFSTILTLTSMESPALTQERSLVSSCKDTNKNQNSQIQK